jgi:hypothetical protein
LEQVLCLNSVRPHPLTQIVPGTRASFRNAPAVRSFSGISKNIR